MNTSSNFRAPWHWILLLAALLASIAAAWAQEAAESEEAGEQPPAVEPAHLELLVNPVFKPDQAERVYRPLVEYLNAATRHRVELVTVRNFHRYWLEARSGKTPDLVLEDAHMAAWRMVNQGYTPLATTRDPTSFSLLTTGAHADDEPADFIGRRISSLPAPSLGYVVLSEWFDNPMRQPLIQSNAASWLDAVEIVFSAEADAAMVPRNLVSRYPNLYPVAESREFPGLTLSTSSEVDPAVAEELLAALEVLHEDSDHYSALHELDIRQFVAADPETYVGLERWLDRVFSM